LLKSRVKYRLIKSKRTVSNYKYGIKKQEIRIRKPRNPKFLKTKSKIELRVLRAVIKKQRINYSTKHPVYDIINL
jgi:hypothetical protein